MFKFLWSKTFRGYALIAIISCLVDALTKKTLSNSVAISIINTSVMAIIAIAFVFLLIKAINCLKELYYQIATTGLNDALKQLHQQVINKIILRLHFVVNAIVVTILSVFRGLGLIRDESFFTIVFISALIFRFLILGKLIEKIKTKFAQLGNKNDSFSDTNNIFELY